MPTVTDSKLTVVLSARGNPDFNQPKDIGVATERVEVSSLREASERCRAFIEVHQLGGGNWTGGRVRDASGKDVANVSYNGRVWEGRATPPKLGKEIVLT